MKPIPYFRWLFLFGLLFPCAAGVHAAPVIIEAGFLRGNLWLKEQIEAFDAAHPEIEVHFYAWETEASNVPLDAAPRLPANVLGTWEGTLESEDLPWLVEHGEIVPLDGFLAEGGFDVDSLPAGAWQSVTLGGRRWGIPYRVDGEVLVINRRLFNEAGISGAPETWTELMEMAGKLARDRDGDGELDQWGFRFDRLERPLETMIAQSGCDFQRNGLFHVDPDAAERAIRLERRLYQAPFARLDARPWAQAMEGDRGVNWSGVADLKDLYGMFVLPIRQVFALQPEPDLEVHPLPQLEDAARGGQLFRFMSLVIRRSTPEQERASWALLQWLSRPDVPLPAQYQGWPIGGGLASREDLDHYYPEGAEAVRQTLRIIQDATGSMALMKHRNEAFAAFWREIDPAIRQEGDIRACIGRGVAAAQALAQPVNAPPPAGAGEDVAALAEAAYEAESGSEQSPLHRVLLDFNTARTAQQGGQFTGALQVYEQMGQHAGRLALATLEQSQVELLAACTRAAYLGTQRMLEAPACFWSLDSTGQTASAGTPDRLMEAHVAAAKELLRRALRTSPVAALDLCGKIVEFCQVEERHDEAVEAWALLIAGVPGTPEADAGTLALGRLYAGPLSAPARAVEVYQRGLLPSPGRKGQQQLLIECAQLLVDQHEFEEAYALVEEFLSGDREPDEFSAAATFLKAIAAARLGYPELAEQLVRGLVESQPEAEAAPKGLLWLAAEKMEQLDYAAARELLQRFVSKYPAAADAARAKELYARLEHLSVAQ